MLTAHSYSPQLKLQWEIQNSAPDEMSRGSSVADDNIIYCISHDLHTVYQYEVDTDMWKEHSQCPYEGTGLAIIKNLLTAVGGKEISGKTNKLLTWRDREWEEIFPPMNTARSAHAVVSSDHYIIAVGGDDDEMSVELFIITTNTWSIVTSLPRPLCRITATLSCNTLYAMDGDGRAFSISMSHWTKNTSRKPSSPHPTWQPLPHDAPVRGSTVTTVCDEVVAVGGVRDDGTATGDVYQLCQREWLRIGCMDIARYHPIVAVLPEDRIVVVGGWFASSYSSIILLTAVELAVVC